MLLDPADKVTYINPAACTMLHLSRRKVLGKEVSIDALLGIEPETTGPESQKRCAEVMDCKQPDCPAYTAEELRCWLVSGTLCHPETGPCTFEQKRTECEECDYHRANAEAFDPLDAEAVSEVELNDEDHELVVKARVSAVVDAGGNYIGRVLALRDVTTEREIADMKNEFVSTVSHELRTPLTSIKGYVDLILDGSAGPINEVQEEFLGIVKENSDRLVELINEMLDISRIESGRVHLRVEPLDMADSIEGAVDTFRAVLSQADRTIDVQVPDNLPLVVADADRVGQVLINLISNALKYSPGGGQVTVNAKHSGDFVVVAVTDQGLGISREDQKRLFTKFYRVDTAMTREIGGTGLGPLDLQDDHRAARRRDRGHQQAGQGLDLLVQRPAGAAGDGAHAVARGTRRSGRHGARHRPRPRGGRRSSRPICAAAATTWSRRTTPTTRWRSRSR